MAEWEEQECVLVVFPHEKSDWKEYLEDIRKSYISFILSICEFEQCVVLCFDEKDASLLPSHENLMIKIIQTNDTWIRDFGMIDFLEDGKIKSYDFTFNAWGGKFEYSLDNSVNKRLYKNGFKGELIKKDFIFEGGSIDVNGDGALITTSSCIFNRNRNPNLTKNQITKTLHEIFGINQLIILNHGFLEGDDTDSHVDILARFIDKNTIAYVSCEDKNDVHFSELKKLESELMQTGFELLALPLPEPLFHEGERLGATYLNFLFVNNALIVPTYNQKNDKIALEKLSRALPSKKIVPVDASVFVRQGGSLHCSSINRFKGKR